MTGIPEIDNLFLFGFAGLIVLVVMLVVFFSGIWKFHKTPKEQRGENDSKLYYFIFAIGLLSLSLHGVRIERYHSPLAAIKQICWIVATKTAFWPKLGCPDLGDLGTEMRI